MNKKIDKKAKYIRLAQEAKMMYDALLTSGFTTEEAFELTKLWVRTNWEFC